MCTQLLYAEELLMKAYKDTETILDLIQDTCEVLYMIKPVVNMKATETVEED